MALSAKDKKAAQRARENAQIEKLGGRRITFLVYGSTLAALEELCKLNGFTGQQRFGDYLSHQIHENHEKVTSHQQRSVKK